ncbi:DUF1294 domain-containing protein [Ruegeria arenilitoris]|uniref:DUF1294 domain-containing protein n=2 Tax=Ruegeria arenilitoris TaxID=1173585 RepID=UPI003464244F
MKIPRDFSLPILILPRYGCGMWIVILYFWAINALTLLVFGWDKLRAIRRRRRVPEKWLLRLALLGGSPAALLGRWIFGHKTRKKRLTTVLYAITALQAGAIYLFLTYSSV